MCVKVGRKATRLLGWGVQVFEFHEIRRNISQLSSL